VQRGNNGCAVQGEHAVAVQARRQWRGRPVGGAVERNVCARRGGAQYHHEFFLICSVQRGADKNG
jgi:hypothetical protein